MKNLIVAFLLSAFILSACKKDQDTASIRGKWYLTRILYKSDDGHVLIDSIVTNRNHYIQFNADGTGSKTASLFQNQRSGAFDYSLVDGQEIRGSLANGLRLLKVSTLSSVDLVLFSSPLDNVSTPEIETRFKR